MSRNQASREQLTEHRRIITAPARTVYGLVADVTLWPVVFGPSLHVHHLERTAHSERFELWATVGGEVSSWISRRTLDDDLMRVTFAQEVSRPPIAAMSGEWRIRELPGGQSEVLLLHRFVPAEDTPSATRWIESALDTNSTGELDRLARVAELGQPLSEIAFSFTDTRWIDGDPADVYDFLERADLWAQRLPHVARVRLAEPAPGVQELEMETATEDGDRHTTRSVRVCRSPEWIAYKQQITPQLLLGHSGLWSVAGAGEGGGAAVSARHTVLLDPAAVTRVLGPGQSLAEARSRVLQALGRNGAATMAYAAGYAEERSEVSPRSGA